MLIIAVLLVCFFDLFIVLLIPSTETMIFTTDGSAARYAVDFSALFIGLWALYFEGWRSCQSRWLLALMLFLVVSHFHAVNIHFEGAFIPNDLAIYDYKPMLECLIFFMMFMGIYSMKLQEDTVVKIKSSLSWVAIIYGLFAILQRLG